MVFNHSDKVLVDCDEEWWRQDGTLDIAEMLLRDNFVKGEVSLLYIRSVSY